MNSKEALDNLFYACDYETLYDLCGISHATELTDIIEKDLDRLKKLEYVLLLIEEYQLINIDELKEFMNDEEATIFKEVFDDIEKRIREALGNE